MSLLNEAPARLRHAPACAPRPRGVHRPHRALGRALGRQGSRGLDSSSSETQNSPANKFTGRNTKMHWSFPAEPCASPASTAASTGRPGSAGTAPRGRRCPTAGRRRRPPGSGGRCSWGRGAARCTGSRRGTGSRRRPRRSRRSVSSFGTRSTSYAAKRGPPSEQYISKKLIFEVLLRKNGNL